MPRKPNRFGETTATSPCKAARSDAKGKKKTSARVSHTRGEGRKGGVGRGRKGEAPRSKGRREKKYRRFAG